MQLKSKLTQIEFCNRLKDAGFDAASLKAVGFDATSLKAAGFDATSLKAAGFGLIPLKTAGFDLQSLKTAGFGLVSLKNEGFDATSLKTVGFDLASLKAAGFDLAVFGFSNLETDLNFNNAPQNIAIIWKTLVENSEVTTSGIFNILNEQDLTHGFFLKQEVIDKHPDYVRFLRHWYMQAKKIFQAGTGGISIDDLKEDFPMEFPSNKYCQMPISKVPQKYLLLLLSFSQHSGKNEKYNFETILRFFQFQRIFPYSDLGIAEDVKSCELYFEIQGYAAEMLPEYKALRDKAISEISRQHIEGPELQALRRSTDLFSERVSAFHAETDCVPDDRPRNRFLACKSVVESMSKFVDFAVDCGGGVEFLSKIDIESKLNRNSDTFLGAVFKLISFFFVVLNDINANVAKHPLPHIGPPITRSNWRAFADVLDANAKVVRDCLASAANEAATRWLHADVSAICYDVCLDTAHHDSSTRPINSEVPSQVFNATNINRNDFLAVDMHPDCQDLIGMRVWYADSVPTSGFNQFFPTKRSSCGVIIVHVFLRYNIAISQLRDQPEKMQAPASARNNVSCGNIQLPSWAQHACVNQIFYQPLLDFLIHDFSQSFDEEREPARLVFTGAAFDAVLATVVASELVYRFNSYREDRLIQKCHSHTTVDWDVLYNHIRSSVFVLSFMLPAVFSGPHLSPDQLMTEKRNKDKLYTPHGAVGINMLNITISKCVPDKLVEYWLSIDRSELAKNHDEWKVFSSFDKKVLETLQKLFSSCKKAAQLRDFEKSIEQAVDEVKRWAESTDANKRQLGTFVADCKSNVLRVGSSFRTVQRKTQHEARRQKLGHSLTDFSLFFQQNHLMASGDWWLGYLSLIKEPFQLLNFSHPLSQVTKKSKDIMVSIASWFLPIAAVHEVSRPQIDSEPLPQRKAASYGTLNASDLPIHEHAYTTYGFQRDSSIGIGVPEANSRTQHASNFAMCSRMLVKPIGNNDRLLIQWKCDSMDSHALIRNCFAVNPECMQILIEICDILCRLNSQFVLNQP